LSRRLDVERRRLRINEFVLLVAPRVLGMLRPQLSRPTRELVSREVTRDLTHATDTRILKAAFSRS
jgi:protein required for attachment to host cells